jgi:hypothetical protein
MSGGFQFRWMDPAFDGDNRHLLLVGALHVGAVFGPFGGKHARFRVWLSRNVNPIEGVAASVDEAKKRVEARVREALSLMAMEAGQ